MVLLANGRILCSGRNNDGQLGIGNTSDQNSPQYVNTFSGSSDEYFAVDINCTGYASFAVTKDGKLWSWGDGTSESRLSRSGSNTSPGKVRINSSSGAELANVARWSIDCSKDENVLACDYHNVLVLLQDGNLYAFGRNYGALGNGNTSSRDYATLINLSSVTPAITGIKSIFGNSARHDVSLSFLISNENKLYTSGNLINNNTNTFTHRLDDIKYVSSGKHHVYFLNTSNVIKAIGYANVGMLGMQMVIIVQIIQLLGQQIHLA